ncbi:hypothetical protein GOODEAATRI_016102 [Goodea atripinnis]|uniref:Tektin n=1 Tax=Goodea atripinnis TaxID=208336 RepID=A0ABV0MI90_9TELE
MKEMAERCLQERRLYSQLMRDCVALSSGLCSAGLRQDQVFIKLKKEEQLSNESGEVLQKKIFILLDKLSSLKTIHSQLLMDFQDKVEAIKLTSRCITFDEETPCSRLLPAPVKSIHVSYEEWLSHCQSLKLTADNLVKDSPTTISLWRDMTWQQWLLVFSWCYSVPSKFPSSVSCLWPIILLTDPPVAILHRQNLGMARRHLAFVEDKLARNAQTLEVVQRCQNFHQSFRLAVDTAVVLSNKPRLCGSLDSSNPHTDLQ